MPNPPPADISSNFTRGSVKRRAPRLLGVLMCYNDADILPDAIDWLLKHNHDLLVINHGSNDETPEILDRYKSAIVQRYDLPREFNFYRLYQWVSMRLLETFVAKYDWISWPDQDEFLEGPARDKPYNAYVEEVLDSPYNWLQFHNFNFWFTEADDTDTPSPVQRVRHYCLWPDCAPRVRAWRAKATNIRVFNHNPGVGAGYPHMFNLRHYPMRSQAQMMRRIYKDRIGIQRGHNNCHYNNMSVRRDTLIVSPDALHCDDGVHALDPTPKFNWRHIYGSGPLVKTA